MHMAMGSTYTAMRLTHALRGTVKGRKRFFTTHWQECGAAETLGVSGR
jgi:hypothetical protein